MFVAVVGEILFVFLMLVLYPEIRYPIAGNRKRGTTSVNFLVGGKMNVHVLVGLFVASLLFGCGSRSLTIVSQPSGASVTELYSRKYIGDAPVTVKYGLSSLEKNKTSSGCYLVNGFLVKWPSGSYTLTDGKIELCQKDNRIVVGRGSSPTGVDVDERNGIAAEKKQELKQKADETQSVKAVDAYMDIFNSTVDTIVETKRQRSAPPRRYSAPDPEPQHYSGCTYRSYSVTTGGKTKYCTQDSSCNVFCY